MLPTQQQILAGMSGGLPGQPMGFGPPFMDPAAGMMAIRMHGGMLPMPGGPHQQMMEANRVPADRDRRMLEEPWKDPRFFPITIDNVMQYFCQRENPFFDINSDNALAMMHNPGISGPQLEEILKQMTGLQFVLVQQPTAAAPLFVVRKQQRMSPDKITPLCHYYVLDGTVYQAPDLHTFLHSRLISIMDPLRNAFMETLKMQRFSPSKGFSWEFRTRPSKLAEDEEPEDLQANYLHIGPQQQKKDKEEDPLSVRATPYQRLRTDMLLQHLATKFKPDKMNMEIPDQPSIMPSSSSQRNAIVGVDADLPTPNFQELLFGDAARSSSAHSQQPQSSGVGGGQTEN